jgi:uncharacterized protein YcbX
VYPVKSLAGVSVRTAVVEPWGLRHDRRWVVLTPDGTRLSAREEHAMLRLLATPTDDGVALTAEHADRLHVRNPTAGELVPTSVSRLESVRLATAEAHEWLSDLLGRSVRLGWLDDPRRRSVSDVHGGLEGDSLTVADAGPLLLTSTASLRQLNEWIVEGASSRGEEPSEPMEMLRFRPNVIVDDVPEPFEEDTWRQVRIGGARFRFAEVCDRCVMTTLDPRTLHAGKEPLRTLAKHRQWDHKTWFGIRVIPTAVAAISVGDDVEALSEGKRQYRDDN